MISEDTKARILREHFAKLGQKGGSKVTPAKTRASRRNVKAAQAATRMYSRCPKYKNQSHRFNPSDVCYGCKKTREEVTITD